MFFYQTLIGSLLLLTAEAQIISGIIAGIAGTRWIPDCEGLANGNYPHLLDCRKYVTCSDNGETTTVNTCPDAYPIQGMWSTTQQKCVYTVYPTCRAKEKNCPSLPKEITSPNRKGVSSSLGAEKLDANIKLEKKEAEELAVEDLVGEYTCSDVADGFFGYGPDCRYYQSCCGAVSRMHRCPRTLEFDIYTRTCVFFTRAHCEPETTTK